MLGKIYGKLRKNFEEIQKSLEENFENTSYVFSEYRGGKFEKP